MAEREGLCANYFPYPNLQALPRDCDAAGTNTGTMGGTLAKRKPPRRSDFDRPLWPRNAVQRGGRVERRRPVRRPRRLRGPSEPSPRRLPGSLGSLQDIGPASLLAGWLVYLLASARSTLPVISR